MPSPVSTPDPDFPPIPGGTSIAVGAPTAELAIGEDGNVSDTANSEFKSGRMGSTIPEDGKDVEIV